MNEPMWFYLVPVGVYSLLIGIGVFIAVDVRAIRRRLDELPPLRKRPAPPKERVL